MNKYLAFDCETGGQLEKDTSLLTVHFLVLDEKFEITAELPLVIRPNSGVYQLTAGAMAVNKIDIIEHDKIATSASDAGQKLRQFLIQHSNDGAIKLVPLGHNVYFDLAYVWEHLLGKLTFNKYCSYRILDTGVLAEALKAAGRLPDNNKGGLAFLVEHLGLKVEEYHTARGDTLMTVDVCKALIDLMRTYV